MYDIFRERGNLVTVFSPRDTELTPETNHIEFSVDELKELDAVIVEIQDVGSRYFNYTKDVFRLMEELKSLKEEAPSLYIVDHINPAGRVVEGTMPSEEQEAYVLMRDKMNWLLEQYVTMAENKGGRHIEIVGELEE